MFNYIIKSVEHVAFYILIFTSISLYADDNVSFQLVFSNDGACHGGDYVTYNSTINIESFQLELVDYGGNDDYTIYGVQGGATEDFGFTMSVENTDTGNVVQGSSNDSFIPAGSGILFYVSGASISGWPSVCIEHLYVNGYSDEYDTTSFYMDGGDCDVWNCHDDADEDCICDHEDDCIDIDSDGVCDYGCTDPNACNYDPNVEFDNYSCWYPQDDYDCEGNYYDCNGTMNGDAEHDYCGVCDGGNYYDEESCDADCELSAETLVVYGSNPDNGFENLSYQDACYDGLGNYHFYWEGGCELDRIVANNGWELHTDGLSPVWWFGWGGFYPGDDISFTVHFKNGTSVNTGFVVNNCPDCSINGEFNGPYSCLECIEDAWHVSEFNAIDGENLWASDESLGGYMDHWTQFMDTPMIAVGEDGHFSAQMNYAIEDYSGDIGWDGSCVDGWDAANIRISNDGGESWSLLEDPYNPYHFECGYGWIDNDYAYEEGGPLNHLASGWGGSSDGWLSFNANLYDYANENIIIRFAFGSDPWVSAVIDDGLTGFQIDDIVISDASGVLYANDGSDDESLTISGNCGADGRGEVASKKSSKQIQGSSKETRDSDYHCGVGPDVGCDGVCFSEAYENEMGDCVYDDENDCSGYAENAYLIEEAQNSDECQAIADLDDNFNWEGSHCDAEMHCVEPGCYQFDNYLEWQDECDGPSECLSDCPDLDILIAFFDEGEGDLNGEDICSLFVSWVDTDCIYDCDDGEINEWEETGNICSECIVNGDCDGLFFNDDCDDGWGCNDGDGTSWYDTQGECNANCNEECEFEDECDSDDMPECLEDCSYEILNLEPFDDPDYYCELALSENVMECFNDCDEEILQSIAETQNICSECLEANNCADQFTNDDCGSGTAGSGDLDGDGELSVTDIIIMFDNILMLDVFDECQISIADLNDDGELNIYDIVRAVDIILGGDNLSRFVGNLLHTPKTIELLQRSKSLDFNSDKRGLVGFDFILSHGPGFSIHLNDNAFISKSYTSNNKTRIVMVIDGGNHLFSTTGKYKIEEMVVGTVDGEMDNVKINYMPENFILSDVYPNPFNPSASFELSMPVEGFASVKIYNIVGQVVGVIHEGNLVANTYSFTWNANDLASGMYLVRAEANGEIAIQKMMLMK